MQRLTMLSLFLWAMISTACTRCAPGSLTPVQLAPQLAEETVALIGQDSDGDTAPYCTGVWVGVQQIITASHCVQDRKSVQYIVHSDQPEMFHPPAAIYTARVKKIDAEHDLALLTTESTAPAIAHLAAATPPVGASLLVMGHPITMYWTLLPGMVAGYQNDLSVMVDKTGPFIQVASGATHGNSGGGIFDDHGELVGLLLMKTPAEYVGFGAHLNTIRAFLK